MSGSSGPVARRCIRSRFVRVFALTTVLPAAVLVLVGVRALLQERGAAERTIEHRILDATGRTARAVDRELDSWRDDIESGGRTSYQARLPPALREAATGEGHVAIASLTGSRTELWPEREVAFVRQTADVASAPSTAALGPAEAAELIDGDYSTALRLYGDLLVAAGPAQRPFFLHRVARTYRKAGLPADALTRFQELKTSTYPIVGLPADLIGSYEVCSFGAAPLDRDRLRPCARELYRDLVRGRWTLDKPRYLYYTATARDWLERAGVSDAELAGLDRVDARKRELTEAVEGALAVAPASTRVTMTGDHLVLSWSGAAAGSGSRYALAVSRDWLETRVWPDRVIADTDRDVDVEIAADDQRVIFRSGLPIPDDGRAPAFLPAPSGWKLRVPLMVRAQPHDRARLARELGRRQTVYLAGLGAVVILMGLGAYFTARVVRQELAVAQLKAEFVAAVSHEFRSPLTGIRQLGEMLMRGRVISDERRRDYYERITSESERLGRLVDNLLDFSRMETGRREYRLEPIDPGPWLRDVAGTFQARWPDSAPRIDVTVPAALPTVGADREALATAVENLLDNALKYSPGRPTVWLSAEAATDGVEIRVRDAGAGIAEADRVRVFEAFQRGTGEINRRVSGVGIGLSLVRHIVEAHGGRIAYESRIGEGTTFTLHLPALSEAPNTVDVPRFSHC